MFTNFLARRYLIQFSIDYDKKKFLNWLRTSCVVSITTVPTRHTWTADFWADFERIIDRAKPSGGTIVGLCQCWKTTFELVL